jgi:hypothetical protein
MHKFIILFLGLICFTFIQQVTGQQTSLSADTNIKVIDGNVSPYNQLHPGDTIFLEPGHRKYLLIRNFTGTQQAPFVFSNKSGVVTISTDHYFGIIFNNCRHFKLTGSGDPQHFYGIRIEKVENGSGLSIGAGSSDAEVEYVYVANTHIAGIYAKTDPDCAFQYTRISLPSTILPFMTVPSTIPAVRACMWVVPNISGKR